MSFETLKATINSNIVSGLPDGIRADFENNPTLQDIVSAFGQDYIYMGSAGIGTSPRTDDNARMYISSGSGEFTAFRDSGNNAINISEGEIAILKGISGVYEKDVFFSGDTVDDAGSVRINDTGSLIQLQAKYDGDWITISEFSYVGGDVTLQSVNAYNLNAGSVVIGDMVESSAHTEVNDYLCVDGEVLISQNEYLYADDFVEDRLESTSGEYIPNTASNSLAEIGMDTINDKCVLYNEAITSKEGVIESIVPSSTDGDFDVTRSSYTNRINRDGFIEQVPPNTASYNYDSGDTRPHLLTEAASTNLITYPKSFGNSYWTKSGASIEGDSSTAGSELVTNGDMSSATGWNLDSGITITGGKMVFSSTQSAYDANQDILTVGNLYLVSFDIENYSAGGIRIDAGTTLGSTFSSNGTHSEYLYCEGTTKMRVRAIGTTTLNVDNVSVKQVQPFEAPKEIPTVGSELVTNGDFDGNADGWTLASNWAYGSNKVTISGSPGGTRNLTQSGILTTGNQTYLISFDILDYVTGSITPVIGGVVGSPIATNQTVEFYFNGTLTTTDLILRASAGSGYSIDNVLVKQVQGNPAMMTNMSSDDIVAWTPNLETDFDVARSSTTTRINASGYIEQVAANVPRLNYDSGDSCPYLLTEDASTNLITYPISFGNSYWTKSGASVVGDSSTAGSEMVLNTSFSEGTLNSTLPTDWEEIGSPTTAVKSNDKVYNGTYSIKVIGDQYAGINQGQTDTNDRFSTVSGKVYKVTWSGYLDTDSLGANYLSILLKDGGGGSVSLSGTSANMTLTYGQWTHGVAYFTSAQTGSDAYIYHIRVQGLGGTSRTVYIDNISVKEVQGFEAPKVLPVANGEELVSGWNNSDFSAFTSSGSDITQMTASGSDENCYDNYGQFDDAKIYQVTFTSSQSVNAQFRNADGSGLGGSYQIILPSISSGANKAFFVGTYNRVGFYSLASFTDTQISNFSVKEVTSYSGGGFEREAYKLVEDTSSGEHKTSTAIISFTSGNTYTYSVCVKAGERDWFLIDSQNPTNWSARAYFDLSNGTIGTVDFGTASITPLVDGWYRCSVTGLSGATAASRVENIIAEADNDKNYTGDGTSGLYLAYAQLEESDYASSLMLPTTEGSTTSRVGDAVNNAGNQSLFSGVNSSGTLYAEIAAFNSNVGNDAAITLSNNTDDYRVFFRYDASVDNRIEAYVIDLSGTVASFTAVLDDITAFSKIALRWGNGTNDMSLFVDGVEAATSATGTPDLTLINLRLSSATGGQHFYGKTKAIAVFEYLSDAEMVTLTT